MKKHKLKVYTLEIFLLAILFFTLIVLNRATYITSALIISTSALVIKHALSKKKILSISKKQVMWLMIAFALIYLGIFYLIGMVKYGFYKSPTIFSFKTLYRFIIPIVLIIISAETIRHRLLSQEVNIRILKKDVNLSGIITFICMILIDLMIYIGVYDLTNYDDFLTVLGFVLFSSISCNLFYNYVSVRYGSSGIIFYRALTALYIYIIPIIPDVYIYFRAFLRMIYPYVLYMILERAFASSEFIVARVEKRKNVFGITILIVIMLAITMLVSCQFKYGILVIGSGSMKGALDIGDAVIYESYENEEIKVGDIIVFKKKGIQLIHRVIKVRNVENEIRYYTKGDANEVMDSGYVTKNDIVGKTKLKIMYIGFPTLWVRQLFT